MLPTQCRWLVVLALLIGAAWVDQAPTGWPSTYDGQDDPLPPGALARLGTTRWRLPAEATYLTFPGGQRLLTASRDGTCQVWLTAGGRQVQRFGSAKWGWSDLALSADGTTLATANEQGRVILWDVTRGRRQREIQAAPASWPAEVVFAADGKSLFTTDSSQQGQLTQWDAATGRQLRLFDGPPYAGPALVRQGCPCLLRSADGRVLATFGHQPQQLKNLVVALWDVKTGKAHRVLSGIGGTSWVSALALSPDGRRLAWASESSQLRLHDLSADKPLLRLDAQLPAGTFVLDGAFSPDGKTLATLLTDGAVYLWDCATGTPRPWRPETPPRSVPPRTSQRGNRLAFSADDKTLATAVGQVVHLLDVATGKALRLFHAWSARSDWQTNRRRQYPGAELFRLRRLVSLANHLLEQAAPPGKENPGRLELDPGLVLQQGPGSVLDGSRTCHRTTARSG
jgi:WD40 repeat protein